MRPATWTFRGDAAAATWTFRGVAAAGDVDVPRRDESPRLRRWTFRGDAAAGDVDVPRSRRGRDVDVPRRRVAAAATFGRDRRETLRYRASDAFKGTDHRGVVLRLRLAADADRAALFARAESGRPHTRELKALGFRDVTVAVSDIAVAWAREMGLDPEAPFWAVVKKRVASDDPCCDRPSGRPADWLVRAQAPLGSADVDGDDDDETRRPGR